MKKKVLGIYFVFMMCLWGIPISTNAKQLSQVPQGYTAIRSVEDLDAVRNNLSGKYILMNDIDLGEATVKDGEYDINGYGWKPIDEFSGTLDGNGYRIKGMHIYGELPRTIQGGGLFGSTYSDAIIKNLGVVDVDIDVICADDSVRTYGALAGYNSGRIENCFTTGKIRFEAESNTIVAVGGMVGDASASNRIISNCYNACEIEQVEAGTDTTLYVGGIVANAPKVEYCYNVGGLNIVKTDTTKYGAVIATGNLTNCYYLNTTADQGHAGGDDNSCVKVSKTQLKSKVYMNKWLQTGTWYIDPYCSFKYPQLIACAQVRLEKMSWVAKPEQTEYEVGDELNLDGAEIELVYDDGVKNVVPITEDMVSGYDKNIVGTQTITVAYMSKKVTYEVKVKEVEATSITIESDVDSVNLGDCFQLKANILPENTTNKTVTWTSSNEAVATVDANGVVSGKSAGVVTISAESANGLVACCKVIVQSDNKLDQGKVPEGYIGIYNIGDLYAIRNNPDKKYILMNDIDMSKDTTKGGVWDIDAHGWSPIMNFTGVFDGNGYRIKGMRIYGDVTDMHNNDSAYIGLFGTAYRATIRNLGLVDVNIDIQGAYKICCGSLLGEIKNEKLGESSNGLDYTLVENCYTTGNIQVKNKTINYTDTFLIGGLVGEGYSKDNIEISNCYNAANITVKDTRECQLISVGGILGCEGTVKHCYNVGILEDVSNLAEQRQCYFGSLIGIGNVESSYFLDSTFAMGVGASGSQNEKECLSLSKNQMKQKVCFGGLDFGNIWYMAPGCSYAYPQLRTCPQIKIYSLVLKTKPKKTEYEVGDDLNLDGATVELLYENYNAKMTEQVTKDMVSGYNMNQIGIQTVYIMVGNIKTSFNIQVNRKAQQIFEQPNSSQYEENNSTEANTEVENIVDNKEVIDVYPGKVKIKSAKNIKGGKVKLAYNHTGTAVKYEIKYSTSKNFRKCKTKYRYFSKNYTLKGLTKSKKYYIKVRAYNEIGGTYYKGKWSAVKVVKVKK